MYTLTKGRMTCRTKITSIAWQLRDNFGWSLSYTPSPASYAPSSLCKSANRSYAKAYAKLM